MENTTQNSAPAGGGWKVMGILAVVFGGLSILFSFIPCLGAYAIYSGSLATVLSIIAFVMANSAKASKMLAIVGLVLSLASVGIGFMRRGENEKFVNDVKNNLSGDSAKINKALNDLKDSLKK